MQGNSGGGPSLRPLLPRPPASKRPLDTDGAVYLPPRKAHTRVACERCRRRKIKCDGKRPICSGCTNGGERCIYLSSDPDESRSTAIKRKFEEAQDRLSNYEQLYLLLKTRSQAEVTEILRRIRAGVDVDDILRYVKDGDLLLQLHLLPETRLRYTFPDFASWPTIFHDPADPYLRTQLLDFSTPVVRGEGSSAPGTATSDPYSYVYQIPYHAARLVDPRLSSIKAVRWTSVTTDDALVSRLLSIYFQFEYIRARPFQKDLFLDDLVQGRTDFCSPLLVNCILANAAHGLTSDPNRVEFWTPRSLPYAFLAEAKRLWDIEIAAEPKLTTIHAALSLSVRYGADGADKIGVPLLTKALEVADKMELFTRLEKGDSKMSIARTFTAWAVFGYHGLIFYYMKRTPCISKPPVTPLPDYAEITKFTGELYVQYPLQLHLTPIQFGTSFLAQMKLNKIMFKINKASSCAGSPATAPPTLRQAIKYYHQLKNWARALPEALQPSKIVMPHHLHLHMEYRHALINLLEPWLSGPEADTPVSLDDGDVQERTTVREIGMHARAHLETLVRLYYLRHSFDSLDIIIILFLLMLGSISVRVLASSSNESEKEGRERGQSYGAKRRDASTFLLCAKGLHDQGRNQYLSSLMFTMLAGLVDSRDEVLVDNLARIRAEFKGTEVKPEYVHMEWPVYSWIDPENRSMGKILETVEDPSIGDEDNSTPSSV